ncbi:MAG: ATP-binding protein [Burkholderiales bacterium]
MPRDALRRYLQSQVESDLGRKMVFVGGPRQVGKTWLGKAVIGDERAYLNYDVAPHRAAILRRELPPTGAWLFDEIHKYRGWRNYLKGLYDQFGPKQRILVTGSARLDLYRFGGDSLQGRYFYLRLHPLSFAELGGAAASDLSDLLVLSGFPEPFFGASEREARRWSLVYRERLVREEVAALENVSDLGKLELLMLALPDRVGSPLSINSLREDLQVSHPTLSRWLDILERVYAIFRVAPFGAPKLRAVKKERKHYHFDWTVVPEPGARFENLVAGHLLKWAEYQADAQGRRVELRYFRDIDGREVDFVLTDKGEPIGFVECKSGDASLSSGLRYLVARFPHVPAWQVSAAGEKDYVSAEGIRVCPAHVLLRQLV